MFLFSNILSKNLAQSQVLCQAAVERILSSSDKNQLFWLGVDPDASVKVDHVEAGPDEKLREDYSNHSHETVDETNDQPTLIPFFKEDSDKRFLDKKK